MSGPTEPGAGRPEGAPPEHDTRAATEPVAARRAELAGRLVEVRERIAAACSAAGRTAREVTLIAVSKTYPASDVCHLAALGVADLGENRDQEAAPKAAEVAAAMTSVHWHFIGQLQRNKCRSVVGYATMVHSVDSVRLADALGTAAERQGRVLDALVQISIDGALHRGGASPTADEPDRELWRVAEAVAGQPSLRLRGAMAVAPLDWAAEPAFARLGELVSQLQARYPEATVLSAGMSADLEPAVAHGATHVRIGGALLGYRPALR